MKKKIFIIILLIIVTLLSIILSIWIGYKKYLDTHYSAYATVIGIEYGTILSFEIEDNQFLDNGIYCITLEALKVVKNKNVKDFDRFDLKYGDKIKVTASPKKLQLFYDDNSNIVIMDGIVKLELLN